MDYFVHPTAICDDDAKIGKGKKIWHFVHICKNTEIGENCILGHCVYIDSGVKIGNNCKFQNNVNVYHGVEIDNNVFVGPNATFTNDMYPRALIWDDSRLVKTYVKEGVSIGALSVIMCGITLGKYCMVGSGSVVTKDVPDHALVFGNPAKVKGFVCKCGLPLKNKIKEENTNIYFKCEKCNEEIVINKKDFALLERR